MESSKYERMSESNAACSVLFTVHQYNFQHIAILMATISTRIRTLRYAFLCYVEEKHPFEKIMLATAEIPNECLMCLWMAKYSPRALSKNNFAVGPACVCVGVHGSKEFLYESAIFSVLVVLFDISGDFVVDVVLWVGSKTLETFEYSDNSQCQLEWMIFIHIAPHNKMHELWKLWACFPSFG